jgi:translation initiation factor 5B
MASKKKGGKKQDDDWAAELGETPDAAPEANTTEDVNGDGEADMGGGGLLAALKKNKNKRAKKGKPVDDFVEGEDPPAADGSVEESNLNGKAPEVANLEEDVFAGTTKKNKPGKKAQDKVTEDPADGSKDEEGGMKSKKEKEKEKKERERQRKKEQVSYGHLSYVTATDVGSSV